MLMEIHQLLVVTLIALVHLLAGKLAFISVIPRSRWLSFASGTSVAYVFIHIFPEIAHAQTSFEQTTSNVLSWFEHHIYLLSMFGLVTFYGIENWMNRNKGSKYNSKTEQVLNKREFYLHAITFSFYNLLIGYLLIHAEHQSLTSLWLFGVAIAFHFLVNDFGLKQRHNMLYKHKVRWLLSFSIILGFLIGKWFSYQEHIALLIYGFLAGAVILNVLKEELPDERESKFIPFLTGIVLYSTLLMIA